MSPLEMMMMIMTLMTLIIMMRMVRHVGSGVKRYGALQDSQSICLLFIHIIIIMYRMVIILITMR